MNRTKARRRLWGTAAAGVLLVLTLEAASAQSAQCKALGTVANQSANSATQFASYAPGHKHIEPLPLQGAMTAGREALQKWILNTAAPLLPKNVSSALNSTANRAFALPPVIVKDAAKRTDAALLTTGLAVAQQIRVAYGIVCPMPSD